MIVPELGGAGDQAVEAAEALEQRAAERVDQLALGQVERDQRGLGAARRAAGVVDLLQGAAGARDQDELGTLAPRRPSPRRHPGRARRR